LGRGKPVDVEVVRSAPRNHERVAEEHPELLEDSVAGGQVETVAKIEEVEMGKTIQVGVRFPTEIVAAIDRFAAEETAKLRANLPGLELSRADAIRVLTTAALQARGYEVEVGIAEAGAEATGKRKRGKTK
jgi:hypothetical protein